MTKALAHPTSAKQQKLPKWQYLKKALKNVEMMRLRASKADGLGIRCKDEF